MAARSCLARREIITSNCCGSTRSPSGWNGCPAQRRNGSTSRSGARCRCKSSSLRPPKPKAGTPNPPKPLPRNLTFFLLLSRKPNVSSKTTFIGAVEIGTSKITVLIGEYTGRELAIIGRGECASRGVIKGTVVDYKAASDSTHSALEQAERDAGERIDCVFLAQ